MEGTVAVQHIIAGFPFRSRIDCVTKVYKRLGVLHVHIAEIVHGSISGGAQGAEHLGHGIIREDNV